MIYGGFGPKEKKNLLNSTKLQTVFTKTFRLTFGFLLTRRLNFLMSTLVFKTEVFLKTIKTRVYSKPSDKHLYLHVKAILQVLIYKALYDKSNLGSKTTMTSGEWTCLISFETAPLTCSERGGSEKFKMKIYVSSGIRTHTRQSTTGKLQRLRPLGHEGLMVISG